MPSLLGADGARDHLLVFENNAELRSLGGLAGSISRIHAEDGEVRDRRTGGDVEVRRPPAARHPAHPGRGAGLRPDPRSVVHEREHDARRDPCRAARRSAVAAGGRRGHRRGVLRRPGRGVLPADRDRPGRGAWLRHGELDRRRRARSRTRSTSGDRPGGPGGRSRTPLPGRSSTRSPPAAAIRSQVIQSLSPESPRAGSGCTASSTTSRTTSRHRDRRRARSAEDEAQVGIYVNDALESKMTYYLTYDADVIARSCSGYAQEVAGSIRLTNTVPEGRRAADRLRDLPRRPVLRGDRARPAAARGLRDGAVRWQHRQARRSTRGAFDPVVTRTSTAGRSHRSSPCSTRGRPRRSSSSCAPARARPARSSSTSRRGRSRARRRPAPERLLNRVPIFGHASHLSGTRPWVRPAAARNVTGMSTTWLTKRRAVDNCRVSSALCRMR